MSIVRIGLGENKKFADGYDAIFGKKDQAEPAATEEPRPEAKPSEEAAPAAKPAE